MFTCTASSLWRLQYHGKGWELQPVARKLNPLEFFFLSANQPQVFLLTTTLFIQRYQFTFSVPSLLGSFKKEKIFLLQNINITFRHILTLYL